MFLLFIKIDIFSRIIMIHK